MQMKPTDIGRMLPEVFQRTLKEATPLNALLDVMEGLQAPSEGVLAGLDRYDAFEVAPGPFAL